MQGYLLHNVPEFRGSEKVMLFDLYDPLHLEALVLTRSDPEPDRSFNVANTVGTLEEQLVRGDFFVCASDKQRDLWLGFLAAVGRVNPRTYGDDPTLRRLIDVVPFGLPDDPPVHTRADAARGGPRHRARRRRGDLGRRPLRLVRPVDADPGHRQGPRRPAPGAPLLPRHAPSQARHRGVRRRHRGASPRRRHWG